jgi:hypothetical protein
MALERIASLLWFSDDFQNFLATISFVALFIRWNKSYFDIFRAKPCNSSFCNLIAQKWPVDLQEMVGQFFTDNSSFWEALLEPCFFLLGMMCGEWGGWRKSGWRTWGRGEPISFGKLIPIYTGYRRFWTCWIIEQPSKWSLWYVNVWTCVL